MVRCLAERAGAGTGYERVRWVAWAGIGRGWLQEVALAGTMIPFLTLPVHELNLQALDRAYSHAQNRHTWQVGRQTPAYRAASPLLRVTIAVVHHSVNCS